MLSFLRNVQNKRDITSEGGSAKVFIVALNNWISQKEYYHWEG